MSTWEIIATVLTAALLPCVALGVWGEAIAALAAFEVASTVATTVLMVLSEAFSRQPFIDLAIVLAMLSLIGAFAFARAMERDL